MTSLDIETTRFDNLMILNRVSHIDNRGEFDKLFNALSVTDFWENLNVEQINISKNKQQGTVRGLHYQLQPYSEKKIVSCISGKIFDVALDLRPKSKTFLEVFTIVLSEQQKNSLLIPEGFAHGFQSLEDESDVLYIHSKNYEAYSERGVSALDPSLKINWPLEITNISERDLNLPLVAQAIKEF
jgi:dTDP-4-dehydrorhamnose 3,5-epimerase